MKGRQSRGLEHAGAGDKRTRGLGPPLFEI